MNSIASRLSHCRAEIKAAEIASQRIPGQVLLLAVSKTKPASDIAQAYACGQRHFAESYLQEALVKQKKLAHFNISWHFIGPIQSNKTRPIASHFSWVHSVDRFKIANRLSEQRPAHLAPLNICLQVNISAQDTKSGVTLAELPELISRVSKLPNLRLRGVMAIPAPEQDKQLQRLPYQQLYHAVKQLGMPALDTFSFGMSGDMGAAIAEGSTMVRIGTAIFGSRDYVA